MARRLDRNLFDIFLKSELFFKYHQELEFNFEMMQMNRVSANFVHEKKQKIERRI